MTVSNPLLLPIFWFEQVDKVEDSFDIVNSGTKPLAAYLFTNNKKLKERFVACISAGGVAINETALHVRIPPSARWNLIGRNFAYWHRPEEE